ncbi:MAG: serine/threonine protein kinase [Rhodospirillaceae bacterium]|nr:serine/threonine protein kinase [Rhodospirillaceae bacterium]|tara:strand:- start:3545 stop:3961 length:417 start_codon:yes stop_codon:yes gene_type:complete
MLVHGTCVNIAGAGVLLRGPSGSGKSDLALRLIDSGAQLVADDQVNLTNEHGNLLARAPAALAGLLEVRGLGLVRVEYVEQASIHMVVDLCPAEAVVRMPEAQHTDLEGISVALIRIAPMEASAPSKIRIALRHRIHV